MTGEVREEVRITPRRTPATAGPARLPSPTPRPAPREGRVALALFLLFAGFYLLTTGAHFYAVDEEVLYLATESLVERRTSALPGGGHDAPLADLDFD